MSDTPRTDAHLAHLNLPDGRKIGLPDATVEFMFQLERSNAELLTALEDMTALAERAMRQANRDGAEYEIDEELSAPRAAIAKARSA